MRLFADRREAGRLLAGELTDHRGRQNTIVLALPRGGVEVGFEVAKALDLPLDVLVVRKLGIPGHEEAAFGGIASGGVWVLDDRVVDATGLDEETIAAIAAREQVELERRERVYREGSELPDLAGKTVIVVDDGLATGATMRTALRSLRSHRPARVVLAVPVAPLATCLSLENEADECICLRSPQDFRAIGQWYADFSQTSDEVVLALMREARAFGRGIAHP